MENYLVRTNNLDLTWQVNRTLELRNIPYFFWIFWFNTYNISTIKTQKYYNDFTPEIFSFFFFLMGTFPPPIRFFYILPDLCNISCFLYIGRLVVRQNYRVYQTKCSFNGRVSRNFVVFGKIEEKKIWHEILRNDFLKNWVTSTYVLWDL